MGLLTMLFLNMVTLLITQEKRVENKKVIRTSYKTTGNFTISEELAQKIHEALI